MPRSEQTSKVIPATARTAAQRPRGPGRESCPPALTGGEKMGPQGAKVDWFTLTWLPVRDVNPDTGECDDPGALPRDLWALLSGWAGGSVVGQECAGRYGYTLGVAFSVVCHGSLVPIGRLDWGGTRHGGRARFDLSGSGCSRISRWGDVHGWAANLAAATITRVDLAVDCLMGEFGVDDAVAWLRAGEFRAAGSGRDPRHSTPGDWLDPQHPYGRTLEVGRRENGKMLRAYEKGRQLGDTVSPWTRFEVEIRNNDRDIPLDVIVQCDRYFVGAYKCLERLLDVAGERIATHQKEGEIALGRLVVHSRSAYGQLVDVLRLKLTAGEVLDVLARPGLPRRLQKSSLVAFHHLGAAALVDLGASV